MTNLAKKMIFLMAAVSAASLHAQNLIVNGSFEAPSVTHPASYSTFSATNLWPWRTGETVFEVWTNGYGGRGGVPYPTDSADGGQNMELLYNASSNSVWQTVPTIPGEAYSFSFYHTPRPLFNTVLTVYINTNVVATFAEDGTELTNFMWRLFTTNFNATSNQTTLRFSDQKVGAGNEGAHLDGVVLERMPRLTIERTNGLNVRCSWLGVFNEVDQLEYSTNLASGSWSKLGPVYTNNQVINSNAVLDNISPTLRNKFYRVSTRP